MYCPAIFSAMFGSPKKLHSPPWYPRTFLVPVLLLMLAPLTLTGFGQDTVDSTERIHLGDLVDIDVVGSTEFDWRGRLSPEGFVSGLRFTESPVYGLCRMPSEVAVEVAEAYGKFLNQPQVNVTILDRSERLPVILYGAVRAQQRFRLLREVYLSELIVISGGITADASGEVTLLRQPRASCGAGDLKEAGAEQVGDSQLLRLTIADLLAGKALANPKVRYGDVITVEESKPVYVMGGVMNPTRIYFREGLTVSRAVASAGGLTKDADAGKVAILRRGSEQGVVTVNLKGVEAGSADDVQLLPYDIIDVAREGGGERRFAPVADALGPDGRSPGSLPLRIID